MVFCNRRYRAINALAADAIVVGSSFDDQLHAFLQAGPIPEAVGREAQWLAERIDRHRSRGDAFEQQLHDGTWIQVREHRLPDGGTSILILDINRYKLAETEFNTLATRFQKAAKIAKFGYWSFDELEDCYEYMSPEVAEMFGRTIEDMLENFNSWEGNYLLLHPDDREEWKRWDAQWDENPRDWDIEYRTVLPNGEIRYIHEIGEIIFDAAGEPLPPLALPTMSLNSNGSRSRCGRRRYARGVVVALARRGRAHSTARDVPAGRATLQLVNTARPVGGR
jgi:PAS domain-containing protein